ncbi:uncharacterized protein LOC107004605 isoform X1 [Solanum pennellii]|uniref:Uncharacterized protein LOC107004605 isoform X1 n=1 Tax=Solanum pennellii TaxID=28526 RepID=A0ABM1UYM1_SOLPN|nr:uncharacterized protein LOC107004605 isoform X1 [Solanum pennellii]
MAVINGKGDATGLPQSSSKKALRDGGSHPWITASLGGTCLWQQDRLRRICYGRLALDLIALAAICVQRLDDSTNSAISWFILHPFGLRLTVVYILERSWVLQCL